MLPTARTGGNCRGPPPRLRSSLPRPVVLLLPALLLSLSAVPASEVGDELRKAGDKVSDAVTELAEVKSGQLWCPVPAVGTKCPSSSPFHYHRCCGSLNNECCLRLQTWAFILLVGIGVAVAAIVLLSVCFFRFPTAIGSQILRCVFCRRNS